MQFVNPVKWVLIKAVRIYQNGISPLSPPKCRFHPTCSSYALEALQVHGAFKGFYLSVWRILRCNPFGKGGFDPVPEPSARRQALRAKKEETGQTPK